MYDFQDNGTVEETIAKLPVPPSGRNEIMREKDALNTELRDLPVAHDPAAWTPHELAKAQAWLHELSGAEAGELVGAVESVRDGCGGSSGPVPRLLASWIEKTAHELKSGTGVSILRGVPVDRLGEDGSGRVFMDVSRALGKPVEQHGGIGIAHVRPSPQGRKRLGFQESGEMPFHADLENVIGFLCLRQATAGGIRKFASAATVYNVMRETSPDQLRTLTEPLHMALLFPHPDHGNRWTRLPFLSVRDGVFNACAYRLHVRQALRLPGVPELTAAQLRALSTFNDVANEVSVSVELKPGDLEYFNNHVVLHTRTEFSNAEPGRHLLRVWLAMAEFRTLHAEHPINLRSRAAA